MLHFVPKLSPAKQNFLKKRFILKDVVRENQLFFTRVIIGWLVMLALFGLLMARLVYLQVVNHDRYTTLSESNRLKVLPLSPTRGLIYDRNGVLLATNRPSYTLELIPEKIPDIPELLAELGEIIKLTPEDVDQFQRQMRRQRRFEPVPLRFRLNFEEVARFSVQRHRFPGVSIKSHLTRYYPLGNSGVHVVGYVGRINEQELQVIDRSNYRGSNYIGKIGVEKAYEAELHGQVGYQEVETNVRSRILRVLERKMPVPGKNLYLNIDMSLQRFIERLVEGERAAVVAVEPQTGGVLALVSNPTYDPNLFVNGIDVKSYNALRNSPDRPLYNRAIRGQYPPGSTVKPFIGLAGLEYRLRNEQSTTWCPGWYRLKGRQHRYRDWKRSGHGHMNFHHAVAQSCDVYFYDLANDLGIDRLHSFMTRFSFGKRTGIDLVGESPGLMPSRDWKRRARQKPWYPGETLIVGIGQGFMLSTPLQVAVATATLATKGQFKPPRVVFAVEDPSILESRVVAFPPQTNVQLRYPGYWNAAIASMEEVVHGRRGTARKIGKDAEYVIAGKTGTAQVIKIKQDERYDASKLAKRFQDHAWFMAFAPLENPRIALAIIVENGGGGSATAAPIARKIMDYYLLPNASALDILEAKASE